MNQLDLHYILFFFCQVYVFCWSRYVVVIDMDLGIWRCLWLVYLMILLIFTFSPFSSFFRQIFFFIWPISLDWIIDFNSFEWLLIFHFSLKCTSYLVISFFLFFLVFFYLRFFFNFCFVVFWILCIFHDGQLITRRIFISRM